MSHEKNNNKPLRSEAWFNNKEHPDHTAIYLERYMNFGLTRQELQSGKPIIGIAQSGSDLAPCNRHHIELSKRIRDGIHAAGGIALEFPIHPIHEMARRPTAALDRNLAFLGLLEILHGYPLDGVVLTTGCDKTTPACLMAASAANVPAIIFSGGPMLNGWDNQKRIGSGSVIWKSREEYSTGAIDYETFMNRVSKAAPSTGHCNTMGTALTMNCLAEVLGMSLPGTADIPAPYHLRAQAAYDTGQHIVSMVWDDVTPSKILTQQAFINGIIACSALGGSTNATIHLQAIAAHLPAVSITLKDWERFGEKIPLLVNCAPAGEYLGEDFHRAGGLAAVMHELIQAGLVAGDCPTVNGKTLEENYHDHTITNPRVIRTVAEPLKPHAGFAVLSGNLFDSAILKKSVIDDVFQQRYLSDPQSPNRFKGRAIVFDGPEDYRKRINSPELDIDENCILVMRYCGPLAFPGSAEVVNMLPPNDLIKKGITVLPCIGDGRQSGTSSSPSILHACPEAILGGGLSLLQTNDIIEIDLERNLVNVQLSNEVLEKRKAAFNPPQSVNQTPWQEIYRKHVNQLDQGGTLETDESYINIIPLNGPPRHSH